MTLKAYALRLSQDPDYMELAMRTAVEEADGIPDGLMTPEEWAKYLAHATHA